MRLADNAPGIVALFLIGCLFVFRGRQLDDPPDRTPAGAAAVAGAHGRRVPRVAPADHGAAGRGAAVAGGGRGLGHGRPADDRVSWNRSPVSRWRSTSRSGWPGGCSATTPMSPLPSCGRRATWPGHAAAARRSSIGVSVGWRRGRRDADGARSGRSGRPWRPATARLHAAGVSFLACGPSAQGRHPGSRTRARGPVSPRAR
jgi:hypothetical protein